ncbi:MAG TPA: class I SAM-dependent methyltransferase [Pseudolabrys sp.]
MRRLQATLLQGIEEFVLKVRKKFSFSSRWKNSALRRRYRRKGVIVPPVGIIKLVTGNYDVEGFIAGGQFTAEHIRNTLKQSQTALADQRSILDFGCGCGRVLSQLKYPQTTELHGCDYNPKLIKWCNKLVPSAKLAVNHLAPPLPYDSGKFDFIYAISTFTHWSVALQKQWIAELTRVLSPASLLLITTHGESYRNEFLKAEQRDSFDKGEPVVRRPGSSGSNRCAAFQPLSFVKNELLKDYLKLDVFLPGGVSGNYGQDTYLVRKI